MYEMRELRSRLTMEIRVCALRFYEALGIPGRAARVPFRPFEMEIQVSAASNAAGWMFRRGLIKWGADLSVQVDDSARVVNGRRGDFIALVVPHLLTPAPAIPVVTYKRRRVSA